ncbi:MAG: glycosyltransferase family 2 protein [Microgenomates group bacterium]
MAQNYQISIIIPTWNTSLITLKCIQTLRRYLPQNFAQIIIVDNGSTDDTAKVMGKLKDIVYIRNSTNLGFAKGNNIGARQANAPTLLFLNSDMELIDSSIVDMVKYFNSHPQIGLIGPRFLNIDLTVQGSVMPPQTPLNAFKQYWLNIPNAYTKYSPNVSLPTPVWAVSGGAVLIKTNLYQQIGGWDERYFFYYEDLELCRQVRTLGQQIYYYPNCQLIHRHGASGTAIVDSKNQWRRLIPSSKLYFGYFTHYLIFLITWSSQKIFGNHQ